MTTNKKKATNYYTHANVKNRNRERKAPRDAGKERLAKTGGKKAEGKMRRR